MRDVHVSTALRKGQEAEAMLPGDREITEEERGRLLGLLDDMSTVLDEVTDEPAQRGRDA
jgi:hypothetical protein